MTNFEDILARLQKGESIDTIGEEFAEAMNRAYEQYQKEQEVNAIETNKIAILREMMELMDEYVEIAKPDVLQEFQEAIDEVDYKEVMKSIDSMLEMVVGLKNLQKLTFPNRGETNGHVRIRVNDADAVLKEFLSKLK